MIVKSNGVNKAGKYIFTCVSQYAQGDIVEHALTGKSYRITDAEIISGDIVYCTREVTNSCVSELKYFKQSELVSEKDII